MQVKEIMTGNPACCTRETGLKDVARMMVEHDCGAIPVVENEKSQKLVGIVTDRDITCRIVAEGKNPLELKASDCMTKTVVSVEPETSLEECSRLMEQHQVRRIPVVDSQGVCCGMVAQADLARKASESQTAEVVQEVSKPTRATAGV